MSEAEQNAMRQPRIEKVVVHMGVGQGGEPLASAEEIIEAITGQQSVRTTAKRTVGEFGIRQGDPVGAKVTLRGEDADEFLDTALEFTDVSKSQFDETGNLSFGVEEHTDFPSQEYDPSIGIFGLDVTVTMSRPGNRVSKRDKASQPIPPTHRLTPEATVEFLEANFDVEVTE